MENSLKRKLSDKTAEQTCIVMTQAKSRTDRMIARQELCQNCEKAQ